HLGFPTGRKQPFAGVTLTDSFIAMKNLPWPVEPLSMELLSPSTLRLDRENICAIGRLQSLQEIHSLYLQQVRPYGRCFPCHHSPILIEE
uniref:Uncharacterized protein n=1 Tax=Falco tinnunculus TaxID=100819 RepID=A0A8C4XJ10_FALTI